MAKISKVHTRGRGYICTQIKDSFQLKCIFYLGTDISFETKNVKSIFLDCCCCCFCLFIQLNPRAQNVFGPWREPHRQYQSELRSTTCSTSWRKIQPIAFGVSFLHSQISVDDLILQVSFTTFRWKEIKEIEKGLLDVYVFSFNYTRFLSVSS